MTFDARDRADLAARGIAIAEAERQLALLREPPPPPVLARACTIGDGIERLDRARQEHLAARYDDARAAGRWTRFVPASGAATRMFQDLLAALARPGGGDAALHEFVAGLPRFAFHPLLAGVLARRGTPLASLVDAGRYGPVLEALLEPDGLGYASLPKGLLAFHHAPEGPRTAFEEQLVEALPLVAGADGVARFHFTVPPEHEAGFRTVLAAARQRRERADVRLAVAFSHQDPATDTIATDDRGAPFRDADGRLVFRPAGHGALLGNLGAPGGDLVFLKNVDNVAPEPRQEPGRWWARVLGGLLDELAGEAARRLRALDDGSGDVAAALAFAREHFGLTPAAAGGDARAHARALLDRPVRVCGMVPNTGEPGGGPFWVRAPDGRLTRQIVEAAQVDPRSDAQRAVFAGGTHFNPVFLACALRAADGAPHDLARYVDPSAVIVTRKSARGRELVALERPGLWNGAMAGWLTVFVEVPGEVFTPVKTVHDLLRPEHQPG